MFLQTNLDGMIEDQIERVDAKSQEIDNDEGSNEFVEIDDSEIEEKI